MGLVYRQYISLSSHSSSGQSQNYIFSCSKCKSHLTTKDKLISKAFHGQHGPAFLFENVINVNEGVSEDRLMTTGQHVVRDVFCLHCDTLLGWKYEYAYEEDQKYKEGKYILEKFLISIV